MMPAGLIPNEGLAAQLLELLGAATPSVMPWELMFWVNDITPDADTVYADLQEATWGGYVRETLERSQWQAPTVSDGCAHSVWGSEAVEWSVTSGPTETNYGYAYIDPSLNVIRFIQRFDTPDITPVVVGGKVLLVPEYTLTSAECE